MEDVIEHFGNAARLAYALGVSRHAAYQWIEKGHFPPKRAIQIERLSGGRFKAVDLIACSKEGLEDG